MDEVNALSSAKYGLKEIKPVDNIFRSNLCVLDINSIVVLFLNNTDKLMAINFNKLFNIVIETMISNNILNSDYFSCLTLFEKTILFSYFQGSKIHLSIRNVTPPYFVEYNNEINDLVINNEEIYPVSHYYSDTEIIKINSIKFVIISKYENNNYLVFIIIIIKICLLPLCCSVI
jgi:hypothetical protein